MINQFSSPRRNERKPVTILRILCCLTFALLLAGCGSHKKPMTEYIPIERAVQRNIITLKPRPDWRTSEHLAHVQELLSANKIPYRREGGRLMIETDLQSDWQTLADYSMKANDPDWNKKRTVIQRQQMLPPPKLNSGWMIQSGQSGG